MGDMNINWLRRNEVEAGMGGLSERLWVWVGGMWCGIFVTESVMLIG